MRARIVALGCALAALVGAGYAAVGGGAAAGADGVESLYAGLRWRLVGPFRGGRVLAVSGVAGRPETFYFGAAGGGVWKTTDAGRVWTPVFDGPPSGSIGALAVAPSSPDVIYAGTGEADMRSDISFGDGVWRSGDGGRTWSRAGLRDSRQIGRILVDPRDPDVVLVAALGHGFGANPERGVFRSADGGKSWRQVLGKDDDTGAVDLAADPGEMRRVFAALWNVRRPPWSTYAPIGGPGSGLYVSGDGGLTWQELSGHGLPAGPLGRIGVAVAAGRQGRLVYALIDAGDAEPARPKGPRKSGLYRSDDGGESWRQVSGDRRITSRPWYFGGLTIDPRDAETVYVSNVSLYRSRDGGRTFAAVKGAPGGDDYHALWIDPGDPARMILGGDQGAVVTVNGGATWSSWFNQPTAQIYHVATDDRFPYWIYGAQQDSGTVAIASRGDFGAITWRDWFSVGTGESGYILPCPDDPDLVYGGEPGGRLFLFSRATRQVQDITPTVGPDEDGPEASRAHRYPWTPALAVAPRPPFALYQGSQLVHRSDDHGMSWITISSDLTRTGAAEEAVREKGVIYTIAPSPAAAGQVWVGTDNGLIRLTRDEGKSWQDATPPGLAEWSMVSLIAASRFAAGTAYAAVDRHQVDDLRPYVFRTRDFGRTWTAITAGFAPAAYVHAVREDPVRQGLLYAATETGVYVSFDDGESWHSLQLNLPPASVRDLAVKGDDLVAATHGRSFWVLDDVTPLRQIAADPLTGTGRQGDPAGVRLFSPAPAFRLRRSENRDTPLPPETPAGANPPAGAIIDYAFAAAPPGEVTLAIRDGKGALVRRFSSDEPPEKMPDGESFPAYWLQPAAPLPKRAGMNRFVWDLRYPPPSALRRQASMGTVYGEETSFEPAGPLALPGLYRVELGVGGRSYAAQLEVRPDPRVKTAPEALAIQLELEIEIGKDLARSYDAVRQIGALRERLAELAGRLDAGAPAGGPRGGRPGDLRGVPQMAGAAADALAARVRELRERTAKLEGDGEEGNSSPAGGASLRSVHAGLAALAIAVGGADAVPTSQARDAFVAYRARLDERLAAWAAMQKGDVPALDALLRRRRLPSLATTSR
ncbi:MAG TPA: hypothetical protein VHQ90_13395 [Thermoanaerobaculia bacterium]|nr:hypothetical protein [Thermoanaerobaculia bacterium]